MQKNTLPLSFRACVAGEESTVWIQVQVDQLELRIIAADSSLALGMTKQKSGMTKMGRLGMTLVD
jgi:hypothetical protein